MSYCCLFWCELYHLWPQLIFFPLFSSLWLEFYGFLDCTRFRYDDSWHVKCFYGLSFPSVNPRMWYYWISSSLFYIWNRIFEYDLFFQVRTFPCTHYLKIIEIVHIYSVFTSFYSDIFFKKSQSFSSSSHLFLFGNSGIVFIFILVLPFYSYQYRPVDPILP